MKRTLIIWLSLFLLSMVSYAEEVVKLNTYKTIVKALTREPQNKGTLLEIAKANKIELPEKDQSLEKVFKSLKINPENTKTIEGYIDMRWTVRRIQVSLKYEMLIEFGLNANGEDTVTKISVIPHKNYLFRKDLWNKKNWDSVIFD